MPRPKTRRGQADPKKQNRWNIASAFTWSPDGQFVAHVMDNRGFVTEITFGETRCLTARTDDASAPRPEACVFAPAGKMIADVQRLTGSGQTARRIFVVSRADR